MVTIIIYRASALFVTGDVLQCKRDEMWTFQSAVVYAYWLFMFSLLYYIDQRQFIRYDTIEEINVDSKAEYTA